MVVGSLRVRLLVREARSLKDKRQVVRGILDRLRHHYNVSAAGFMQAKVADRLQTRFTPVITCVLDKGVKQSIEVTRLINEALAGSKPAAGADDTAGPASQAGAADGSAEEPPA